MRSIHELMTDSAQPPHNFQHTPFPVDIIAMVGDTARMATGSMFVFTESASVPAEVGGLYLQYVEVRDEHDPVTICRYEADTRDGQMLGANTFLYDRQLSLQEGASSHEVIEERDQSLRMLRGGAIEPRTLGKRCLSLPFAAGHRLDWQWASVREGDALTTHVAIRVDRGYFNKVLFSYPLAADEIGRKAFTVFLLEWHHCVTAA